MKARFLIPVGIVAALLVVLAVGLTLNPREVPSPLIGKAAPPFALPRLYQPDQLVTDASLKGRVTLFNVWASWCVACREEHAQIERLAKEFGMYIIGLNYKDETQDALGWLSHFGNPYSAVAVDADGRVGIDWGVYGVPETFVIDSAGVIRYKHIGPVKAADIENRILPLVRELEGGQG